MRKVIFVLCMSFVLCSTACNKAQSDADTSDNMQIGASSEADVVDEEEQKSENRFLAYDFNAVSDPIVFNENPVITKPLPAGYEHFGSSTF